MFLFEKPSPVSVDVDINEGLIIGIFNEETKLGLSLFLERKKLHNTVCNYNIEQLLVYLLNHTRNDLFRFPPSIS